MESSWVVHICAIDIAFVGGYGTEAAGTSTAVEVWLLLLHTVAGAGEAVSVPAQDEHHCEYSYY